MKLLDGLRAWWRGPGGGREVLRLAYPLILSHMTFSLQVFVDRLMLTWHSPEAVAAATSGLFVTWGLIGLCTGTGEYVTTFVAQYLGAGRPERIGAAMWQGVYFALISGAVVAALSPLVAVGFQAVGHPPLVESYEIAYARQLLLGAFPLILLPTLASFFAGRGRTEVVLAVNVLVTALNVVLDYAWIFGNWGLPALGVAGAALATVVSHAMGAAAFFALMLARRYRIRYGTLSGWRPEPALFVRLLRFGLPAGLHGSAEIFAFALFILVIGRLGTVPMAATGIAFNLNGILFVPMLGLGLGLSAVVGRHMGAGHSEHAERATWSAFWASLAYMVVCCSFYAFAPRLLLAPFAAGADPGSFAEVGELTVVLLRFVAVYSTFDMMNAVFAAGLRGAGDTAYPLRASLFASVCVMLVPTWVLCVELGHGILVAWSTAAGYVFTVGLLMLRRYRAGAWKELRLVEGPPGPDLEAR